MGCAVIVAAILVGGPLLLLLRFVTTGAASVAVALAATLALDGLFVVLLRW